jgi:GntP family gluconate:H+ symporter
MSNASSYFSNQKGGSMQVSALGTLIGLALSITLIVKKNNPVYSLILGALVGGVTGGASLPETVLLMVDGAKGITPAILRILTAGVLAGVLIESGAAVKIAETIIEKLGSKRAILALALATMLLTTVGVFISVAVITVSPIAITIAKRLKISKMSILLAMIGGGKSGNIISPNSNTIVSSQNFGVDLSSLMAANIIPAIFGVVVTCFLAQTLIKKGEQILESEEENLVKELPSFFSSMTGPVIAIILLALGPITGIYVDPLVALPLGGAIGCLAMGKQSYFKEYIQYGLSKMTEIAILLLSTGTVAGIIKHSTLKDVTIELLDKSGFPEFLLAPISGALMSAATASTTAAATVASATFSTAIVAAGVKALYGAAMLHAGATVFDHLPHGSFFHTTASCTNTNLGERFKLIPYESAIGFTLTLLSTIIYGLIL